MKQTIKSFHDLNAWKEGHELVVMIYNTTKTFPVTESYGITDQLRRAVRSVTANIAEGFGRRTGRDKAHYFSISLGSLREVHNHLMDARDTGLLFPQQFDDLQSKASVVGRITMGLYKSAISMPDFAPHTKYNIQNTTYKNNRSTQQPDDKKKAQPS